MNTPKAFANFSPGFEHRENPGNVISTDDETLKRFVERGTLSGLSATFKTVPGLSLRSNPGLKISERLRRTVSGFLVTNEDLCDRLLITHQIKKEAGRLVLRTQNRP